MVNRILLLLILVILRLLSVASPVTAAGEKNNGIIEGSLVNMTTGAKVPAQTVMLLAYQGNTNPTTKTARTDEDGTFVFEGLSTDTAYVYGIGARYQDVDYYSGPIRFTSGETNKSVGVAVYDVTMADESITSMMSHAIVSFDKGVITVKEYYLIANNSNYTFIGQEAPDAAGNREALKFSLPEGAVNFQSSYGLSDYEVRNGTDIYDSSPVIPGSTEVSFTYNLPCRSNEYKLSLKTNYATARFDLLFADENIKVASSKLAESVPLTISNRQYRDFSAQNLLPGVIEVQLSGLPLSAGTATEGNPLKWAWLAIVPVIIVGFILLRKRKVKTLAAASPRDVLLAEIADLDDKYEAQELNEEDYLNLRKQRKQQLLKIIKDERG